MLVSRICGRVGTYAIGDNMRVTVQTTFWISVICVVSGQVPDDEGFVTAAGEEHVWVL